MADLRVIAHGPHGTVLVNPEQIECVLIRQERMGSWTAEFHLSTKRVIKTGEWLDRDGLLAMIKHGLDPQTQESPAASIGG